MCLQADSKDIIAAHDMKVRQGGRDDEKSKMAG